MPPRSLAAPASVVGHLLQPLLEARGTVQLLRLLAVCAVIWYERLVFRLAALQCVAPSPRTASATTAATTTLRLTLLSDPQLIDAHTYPWVADLVAPLASLVGHTLRWASDTYARKSFAAVVRGSGRSGSDAVVWLGDLLDGGRRPFASSDDVGEYEGQARRFDGLFPESLPSIYVPGNHDVRVPLTHNPVFEEESKASRARWLEEWGIWHDEQRDRATWSRRHGRERLVLYPRGGPTQVNVDTGGGKWSRIVNARFPLYLNASSAAAPTHELIVVDSLALAGMLPAAIASDGGFDWRREAQQRFPDTHRFVESLGQEPQPTTQRILFSHIPLWRPPNSACNLASAQHSVTRETGGAIDQGVDQYATYQNLVSQPVTDWLLDSVRPTLVFSGDNHDHCEVEHAHRGGMATELTLKAFSMTEGVRLPGYARLSLHADGALAQSTYVPCLLPDQIAIWTVSYPLLLALFTACLLVDRKWRLGTGLDQRARRWLIQWQDWVRLHGSDDSDDDGEEAWHLVEEGDAGGDDDSNDSERHTHLSPLSPSGPKRIRFGRPATASPAKSRFKVPTARSSPFQARAWRELRRAARANEAVVLRSGPLRELARLLLWPLVVWLWLQLF